MFSLTYAIWKGCLDGRQIWIPPHLCCCLFQKEKHIASLEDAFQNDSERVQGSNNFTWFVCFIFLFTAPLFLKPRRDGGALAHRNPGHVGEWKALAPSTFPYFSVGTSPAPLLSSKGALITPAMLDWAWKIPSSLSRGVQLRWGWGFLKGTIPGKLTAKQKKKENPWIIAAVGLAGSVTKVWALMGPPEAKPWSLGLAQYSPFFPVILPRVAQFCSCSPCRSAVGWAISVATILTFPAKPYPWVPEGSSRNTDIKTRDEGKGRVGGWSGPGRGRGLQSPPPGFALTLSNIWIPEPQSWPSQGSLWPADQVQGLQRAGCLTQSDQKMWVSNFWRDKHLNRLTW